MSDLSAPRIDSLCQGMKQQEVSKSIDHYVGKFADSQDTSGSDAVNKKEVVEDRVQTAERMTETFYNLVTDFYEYGYGQSFHFAPLYSAKSFSECIADIEKTVGKMIGAKQDMKILDVGCGIGGPGREIARTTGASVLGLNYNDYQIERAKKHSRRAQLEHLCSYIKGDFCDMKDLDDCSFDGAFAFEATCHSKDPVLVYKEILRVLKPGALFVDVTWCMTDAYNPDNPLHVKTKNDVMFGNSLPELRTAKEILDFVREAGLELVEFRDLTRDGDQPWYRNLEGSGCSLTNFRMSTVGRWLTHCTLSVLETVSLVPKGTTKVSSMLQVGANSLVRSGKMEIFTPMFRLMARKPAEK